MQRVVAQLSAMQYTPIYMVTYMMMSNVSQAYTFMQISASMFKMQTTYMMPIPMGQCKKDVTPLLTHWNYVVLALTHRSIWCIYRRSKVVRDWWPYWFTWYPLWVVTRSLASVSVGLLSVHVTWWLPFDWLTHWSRDKMARDKIDAISADDIFKCMFVNENV